MIRMELLADGNEGQVWWVTSSPGTGGNAFGLSRHDSLGDQGDIYPAK
jgi:hypothetical protein